MSAFWYGRRRCAAHRGRVVAAVVVTAAVLAAPAPGLAATGWSGPTVIDNANPPQNVSCPTATFCAAVGAGGWGQTFNGSSWGAPVNIDPSSNPSGHTLTAISCPSASFCAAVDQAGNALTFNGSSWTAPVSLENGALTTVSCTSASFCVAGDNSGNGFTYNGSAWSGPIIVNHVSNSEDIGGISCPSASLCVAVGQNGTFETSTTGGSTWTVPQTIKSGVNLQAVSCASTGFCMSVDNAGNAYTYNGSAWSAPTPIDTATAQIDGGEFTAVSCPASSFCVAIDGRENVLTFNGSGWSAPQPLTSAVEHPGVSCASASFCAAVDGAGNAFLFGAATPPPPPPPAPVALPAPVLGKTVNATPVSGVVFVKPPRGKSLDIGGRVLAGATAGAGAGFVRLTAAAQIPVGSEVNSLRGSLKLVTATAKKGRTQSGTFRGAIFKLTQATRGSSKGLATLSLVESAFKGAPAYATCERKAKATEASAAAVSSKVLQLLRASAHGKFRTRGRYSAATVLGTIWTVADRCDGTLTHDVTDSVRVTDFVRHRTVVLHAGQSYLARAPGRK
jgi:hypothetical protein